MSLQLHALEVAYGAVTAVRGVSVTVSPGEVVAVIGPNGAGKTSLLGAAMGLIASAGRVELNGTELTGKPAHVRARAGLGYVPSQRGVFTALTVRDHVRMAAGKRAEAEWRRLAGWFPILQQKQGALGSQLSGGQQQIVSIARAMAASPAFILMDEPSIGLSPIATALLTDAIGVLRREKVGILLTEQNAGLALSISDRCLLLVRGEIHLSGTPAELRQRPEVEALYMGRMLD